MSVVDCFTVVGGLANLAMAVAAWKALGQWKTQLTGASGHELAKQLTVALREVTLRRNIAVKNIEWLYELEMDPNASDTLMALAVRETENSADELSAAVTALGALDGQIEGQWGTDVFGLFDIIRQESAILSTVAYISVRPDIRDTDAAKVVTSSVAPSFTGGTWTKSMNAYTELAQQWLGMHVGRTGAASRSVSELKAKREGIDREAKVLADPDVQRLKRVAQRVLESNSRATTGDPDSAM